MTLVFGERADVVVQATGSHGLTLGTRIDAVGVRHAIDWASVAGATAAQVDTAGVTIAPGSGATSPISLGTASAVVRSKGIEVTVPGGAAPVRNLTMSNLRLTDGNVAVSSQSDLGGKRISVAPADPGGGFGAPVVIVPALGRKGEVPSRLGGGSFSSGVLTLPDLVTTALRITIVTGDDPVDFDAQALSVGAVTVRRAPVPADLQLGGADGQVLWAFPGWYDLTAPPADIDLVVPFELALGAALSEGAAPATAATLTAVTQGTAVVGLRGPTGALLRGLPDLTAHTAGAPAALAAGAAPLDPPLAGEVPASAIGDLVIRYDGIRTHPVSDALGTGPHTGPVVGSEPRQRVLPAAALDGEQVAAVAILGRAPVDCDVSVRLVDSVDGTPLGDPGTVAIAAATGPEIRPHWVTLPPAAPVARPVAVSVTATRGRLLWAADPDPLVAIAVHDPDPGGRQVFIGDHSVPLDLSQVSLTAHAFPPAIFAGGDGPMVDSACWCEVSLRNVVLRYPR